MIEILKQSCVCICTILPELLWFWYVRSMKAQAAPKRGLMACTLKLFSGQIQDNAGCHTRTLKSGLIAYHGDIQWFTRLYKVRGLLCKVL